MVLNRTVATCRIHWAKCWRCANVIVHKTHRANRWIAEQRLMRVYCARSSPFKQQTWTETWTGFQLSLFTFGIGIGLPLYRAVPHSQPIRHSDIVSTCIRIMYGMHWQILAFTHTHIGASAYTYALFVSHAHTHARTVGDSYGACLLLTYRLNLSIRTCIYSNMWNLTSFAVLPLLVLSDFKPLEATTTERSSRFIVKIAMNFSTFNIFLKKIAWNAARVNLLGWPRKIRISDIQQLTNV